MVKAMTANPLFAAQVTIQAFIRQVQELEAKIVTLQTALEEQRANGYKEADIGARPEGEPAQKT